MKASTTTQTSGSAWRGITDLQRMGLKELRSEYERVFGKPTKSRSRKHLFTKIARKLQETGQASGAGKSRRSALTAKFQPKRKPSKKTDKARKAKSPRKRQPRPIGTRDPRLPKVGATITKTYKGRTINVRVREGGFEYEGREFRSLSAVAKHVTGAIWNGFLFFGLGKRETKKR
jgi:hypothetical protein